jgi:HSP20 family protein
MTKSKDIKDLAPLYLWKPSIMFEEMERFLNDRNWDRDRLWLPPMMRSIHRVPVIDLKEEESRYVMTAELPGMTKEDVSIEIGDGILELTARKERVAEEEGEGFLRRERGSMCFHRRLVLPEDADTQGVEAKLNEGILEVNIPKEMRESDRKKVDVQ